MCNISHLNYEFREGVIDLYLIRKRTAKRGFSMKFFQKKRLLPDLPFLHRP
jgi:hypothetical protein